MQSCPLVILKEYQISFKSGNDIILDAHIYNLCEFEIMAGGINPKAQPLEKGSKVCI